MTTSYPPTLLADFYKVSHVEQYPPGTERVYSTWTPRASRIPGVNEVVTFGIQAFIQKYLVDYFNEHFFDQPRTQVIDEYRRVISNTLGVANPKVDHLEKLWSLGYLPLEIRAVPEGTPVPLRVPMLTVENTDDCAFFLTNFIETLFSAEVWQPATSATIAWQYRRILDGWATITGGDPEFVQFQGHDFSMRGMPGIDAAAASGAGHLLSFSGTDTIPAILFAERYYGADIEHELVGTSIPATEHSVMCAGGKQDEFQTYKRLITDVYPSGMVSIVSDTWDLWHVLTKVLVDLRDEILGRDGKVVIRPDSGDPVDIICGDPSAIPGSPAAKGVVELLWDTFGGTVNSKGFRQLDPHVGVIYGDAITLERCESICNRLARKCFASTNMVYGIGSYTYQHQTRDTFSFALKSTWVRINGEGVNIFKDPVTDNGTKKSLTGRVSVVPGAHGGGLIAVDGLTELEQLKGSAHDLLQPVFCNGQILRTQSFADVRSTLRQHTK